LGVVGLCTWGSGVAWAAHMSAEEREMMEMNRIALEYELGELELSNVM
jgi:hypothetical protein